MIELFRRSSQEDRVILDTQLKELQNLSKTEPEGRDAVWTARRDFAVAVARDTLKRAIPSDTALAAEIEKLSQAVVDAKLEKTDINKGELAFFQTALRNINWSNVGATGEPMPIDSAYRQISTALPELIYRHPSFKFLITAIVALLVLIGTGTFKFYNLTVDVQHKIDAKSDALQAQLDAQTKTLNASMKAQLQQTSGLDNQLEDLVKRANAASLSLKSLQNDAAVTIGNITAEATRKINADVESGQATFDDKLDEARKRAIAVVAAAGTTRAKEVANSNGEQGFIDKLRDFESKSAKAVNDVESLQEKQKLLTEGIEDLRKRQVNYEKMALVSKNDSFFINKLATYFDVAVKYVWTTVGILILSCVINIAMLIRTRRPGK